jgi:hypothetical protein
MDRVLGMRRQLTFLAMAAVGLAAFQAWPADAWMRRGGSYDGNRWGAAAGGGHWAAGANGHYGSGSYGTNSSGTHYATDARGGSVEASNGSWASKSASGQKNSGSYGTTSYGTHYATGSYGGAVARNNGHWGAESGGQYAYGSHYGGTTAYGGAYHPPAVVNQYYGTGCYSCGGWSGAAVVAGAAVGVTVANANARAAYAANAYAVGDVYAALPAGCGYAPYGGLAYYNCGGTIFSPAYGANGIYYRVVPPP